MTHSYRALRLIIVSFLLFFFCTSIKAVYVTTEVRVFPEKGKIADFNFYGFVRNDFTWDSRRNMAVVGELFNFVPLDRNLNALGEDLNAIPNSRLLAISTRLGVDLSFAEIGKTKINTKIEADFCGTGTTYFMLMLRQAYVQFRWGKHTLLVGQTWHPMSIDMMPTVLSLNTGAPFNPFSRTPQVRYDVSLENFRISTAAMYQMQYTSPGPAGNSLEYQINGGLPELYLSLEYKKNSLLAGISGEYQMIRPRTTGIIIQNGEPIEVKVSDRVHSYAASAYIGYKGYKLDIKAKTIYGQNLGHLLMLSGYGITGNLPNGSNTYTGLNSSASWINITYGHEYLIGLFCGYMKNLGASKPLSPNHNVFVRGFNNIDQIVRIAPSFTYNIKGVNVGLEYEMTGAFYGETINDNYSVSNTHFVPNHRIYCVVSYLFSNKLW